ncbi:glycosyltransferase [Streptomyces roseolilacinus]|uniref:Glycosyl transferase family 1 n=1 Tax=Streptomyces roseolilacinus TaxID=66904 RepID=A0A918B531_9ACTN|nr:glycosyltransferase [Streptomyces roseolilacinus]GGQ28518.1 glycosyl transferase family 1 [Streptomyces roseolilacinus]
MRPPLTALHVVQPGDGGVARVVTDVVGAHVAQGMRVAVACPPDTPLAAAARAGGAEVHPWPARREPGRDVVAESRAVAGLVALVRPHLVHAHSAKAGLAARLAVRGRLPTVYQPHAWSFEAVDGPTAALARRWERWAARWTDRVICVSEAERRRGEQAGVRASWTVVHNGVDTGRFGPYPTGAERAAARTALLAGTPAAAPVVVCVGRLCRQKGQDVLLRAWDTVRARVPLARLVLVGDGPAAGGLRAAAHPSVLLAGAVADPLPWYRAADLVVLPSRWEGMALAPLEAMASGRPVLLTDVDGARESLPPGQAAHCLVPPGDADALAAALVRLLQRPILRQTLGRQAHQHVLARFDVRRAGAAIADVYREVAAGARHHERREPITQ